MEPGGGGKETTLTGQVLAAAIAVHRAIGPGLLESVYEECLAEELRCLDLTFERQVGVPLVYHGMRLQTAFRVDLLVDRFLLVEVKSVEALAPVHHAQVLTYLRLTGLPLGLLINFNVPLLRQGIRRIVNGAGVDIKASAR